MTIAQLKAALLKAKDSGDPEITHIEADELLLEYVDHPEITEIWRGLKIHYSS